MSAAVDEDGTEWSSRLPVSFTTRWIVERAKEVTPAEEGLAGRSTTSTSPSHSHPLTPAQIGGILAGSFGTIILFGLFFWCLSRRGRPYSTPPSSNTSSRSSTPTSFPPKPLSEKRPVVNPSPTKPSVPIRPPKVNFTPVNVPPPPPPPPGPAPTPKPPSKPAFPLGSTAPPLKKPSKYPPGSTAPPLNKPYPYPPGNTAPSENKPNPPGNTAPPLSQPYPYPPGNPVPPPNKPYPYPPSNPFGSFPPGLFPNPFAPDKFHTKPPPPNPPAPIPASRPSLRPTGNPNILYTKDPETSKNVYTAVRRRPREPKGIAHRGGQILRMRGFSRRRRNARARERVLIVEISTTTSSSTMSSGSSSRTDGSEDVIMAEPEQALRSTMRRKRSELKRQQKRQGG